MEFIKKHKWTILMVLILIVYFVFAPYVDEASGWFLAPVMLYFIDAVCAFRKNQEEMQTKLDQLEKTNAELLKKLDGIMNESDIADGSAKE